MPDPGIESRISCSQRYTNNNHSYLISEINLEPRDKVYRIPRYESGLVRIAFAKGNAAHSKYLYGGPLLSDKEPFRSLLLQKKLGIDNWNKDFHNYTVIWKTGK